MTPSKRLVAATMIAALAAGAALPAISDAATTTVTRTSNYHISVNPGVLAPGGSTVNAKAVVSNPQKTVSNWYSRATIQKVVRKAADEGIQKPFNYQGYRCVPVLDGSMNASTARFTCKLNGADVPTTVKLTFTIPFKPATA
jgi:hypothetical protein